MIDLSGWCQIKRPYADKLIVTRYQKPDSIHGIIIPEAYRGDRSQTLWELVAWNEPQARNSLFKHGIVILDHEGGNCALVTELSTAAAIPLYEGMIVQTKAWSQIDLGDGKHFIIEAQNVNALHVWEVEDE